MVEHPQTIVEFKPHVDELFAHILSDKDLHCRWLNILSYLEFQGFRKISKYLNHRTPSLEELQHASEESRHAWYFKRKSLRLNPNQERDGFQVLGGTNAKRYLDALEIKLLRGFKSNKNREFFYLGLTWLIEIRAYWLYLLYEKALKEAESPLSISSIIKEEVGHLYKTEKRLEELDPLSWIELKTRGVGIESEVFAKVWKSFYTP